MNKITPGEWREGDTLYHPEYNAYLTMIVTGEGEDELCIAEVFGQSEEESRANVNHIINSIKKAHE